MQTGTVKWFNAKKGFGFVLVDGVDRDIFVHYSVIDGDGFRTLAEGERVQVDFGDDGRGPRARRVCRLEPAEVKQGA
jgi:CspA family cold shock protein